MDIITFLIIVIVLIIVVALLARNVKRVIIFEQERGLLYVSGKYSRTLEPGIHWYFTPIHYVSKSDVRARVVNLPGQEVLTADNVTIRISLAATYKIIDLARATLTIANYQEALYLNLQLQLRDLVGVTPVDELLLKRKELSATIFESAKTQAVELGLELVNVGIKDIMFPGELKNIFAQVINARNEGLAALERARGESAALRNLANTAKLLENNPALLQLRLLQAVGTSSGNTIVLKLPDDADPDVLPKTKPANS